LEGMENFFKRINLGLEYFKVTEMSNNICLDGKNISKKEEKLLYLALSINDSITPFSLKNGTVKTKKFEEKKLTFNCEKA